MDCLSHAAGVGGGHGRRRTERPAALDVAGHAVRARSAWRLRLSPGGGGVRRRGEIAVRRTVVERPPLSTRGVDGVVRAVGHASRQSCLRHPHLRLRGNSRLQVLDHRRQVLPRAATFQRPCERVLRDARRGDDRCGWRAGLHAARAELPHRHRRRRRVRVCSVLSVPRCRTADGFSSALPKCAARPRFRRASARGCDRSATQRHAVPPYESGRCSSGSTSERCRRG